MDSATTIIELLRLAPSQWPLVALYFLGRAYLSRHTDEVRALRTDVQALQAERREVLSALLTASKEHGRLLSQLISILGHPPQYRTPAPSIPTSPDLTPAREFAPTPVSARHDESTVATTVADTPEQPSTNTLLRALQAKVGRKGGA